MIAASAGGGQVGQVGPFETHRVSLSSTLEQTGVELVSKPSAQVGKAQPHWSGPWSGCFGLVSMASPPLRTVHVDVLRVLGAPAVGNARRDRTLVVHQARLKAFFDRFCSGGLPKVRPSRSQTVQVQVHVRGGVAAVQ